MIANENEFYNHEVKEIFLKQMSIEKPATINSYKRLFRAIRYDEERYKSDFCNFNYEVLQCILSNRLSRSRNSRHAQLSLLRGYIKWCITNGFKESKDNPLRSIKTTDLDTSAQIKRQFIPNPERLDEILDTVLPSEKEENASAIMHRMACWLMYEGFTDEEMIELEKSDVDFNNNTVTSRLSGHSIQMTSVLKNLIKLAIDLQYDIRTHLEGGKRFLQLEDNNKLFRKIARHDSANKVKPLRVKLSNMSKDYTEQTYEEISLSTNRLWLSGIFYRLHQKELNGEVLTDDDFKFGVKDTLAEVNKIAKIKFNRRDYEDWKKAFKLE